jgi:XTP/dITP diphosphohydrolase
MEIVFVTGNKRKVAEAEDACKSYGIVIKQSVLEIDEIQSDNPTKISEHKAREAFKLIQVPLVVTDTFWCVPALNGFPGAYMKDVSRWLSPDDFIQLMENKTDKSIMFSENIVYIDKEQIKHFTKIFTGKIVPPRGIGESIEQVAEFNGATLGEQREKGGFGYAAEDYVWSDFAKWFSVDRAKKS